MPQSTQLKQLKKFKEMLTTFLWFYCFTTNSGTKKIKPKKLQNKMMGDVDDMVSQLIEIINKTIKFNS